MIFLPLIIIINITNKNSLKTYNIFIQIFLFNIRKNKINKFKLQNYKKI